MLRVTDAQMHRGHPSVVLGVGVCPQVNEETHSFGVSAQTGQMEGVVSMLVWGGGVGVKVRLAAGHANGCKISTCCGCEETVVDVGMLHVGLSRL